jgi:hypothetical protein
MGRHPQARHGAECPPPCGSHLQEKRETSPGGGTAPTLPPAARGQQQQGQGPACQARHESCKARGHGQGRGAKGEDQGGEDDVARHLIQPGGAGSSTCTLRVGPDPGPGPSTTRCPDCSHSGRSNRQIPGNYRAAAATVSVLKMGSDVLAGPVSHLVNMSLSAGVFPSAFKTALIHPVYKGGGKARNDPASYRPVAILRALSKVLETVAKEDLEAYMAVNNILPTSQHGFRRGRSCTTALATSDRPTNVLTK